MRRTFGLCCLSLLAALGCASKDSDPPKIVAAQAALAQGDLTTVQRLVSEIPQTDSSWGEGQMILGAVAQRAGDAQAALTHYQAIPQDGAAVSLAAALAAAKAERSLGRLHSAIRSYAYVLKHRPHDLQAQGEIASLYAVTGQRRLADQHLSELIKTTTLDLKQRVLLTDFDRIDPKAFQFLRQCEEQSPDDPAVNLGLAMGDIAEGKLKSARRRLEAAVQADPELSAAQGLLGELLLDEGEAELQQWHDQLPSSIHDDAEIWYVRGMWAQRRGEAEIAARCLWEAARRIPTSHRAMHQLALATAELDPTISQAFSQRALAMYELRQHLSKALNTQGRDEAAMKQVITLLLESGRDWEARSWTVFVQGLYPESAWVGRALDQASIDSDAPRIRDSKNVLLRYDLSHYAGFPQPRSQSSTIAEGAADATRGSRIQFVDQAAQLGLDFVYHQGQIAGKAGVRMQESTGGGVGVLDYDGDDLPDLFFTQGEDWHHDSDAPSPTAKYQDRLYRNSGTDFRDVTLEAGVPIEGGFGQGCSAGDFNNDGFADLYVANIGVNQLLINNGDGTFADVTKQLNLSASAWTTSCLIADLNDDGNPDLFDVNYLEGELLYRKICDEQSCTPQSFRFAKDQLYLSQGDGTIHPFEISGEERWGAGLGMVAFRLAGSRSETTTSSVAATGNTEGAPHFADAERLCVFIANDHEPNFLLVNTPAENSDNLALTDFAFARGLAVNKDGKPTACMGVASGDLNGDGQLDLFVTNYKNEANSLYLQGLHGYFSDAIAGSGLMAPGFPYVGWGTQCLDADNDGWLDLIVANGHVGDFRKEGLECYMPTQFFRNTGRGQFDELSPDQLGPYFEQKLLGRSVATLDWNRDGLTDVIHSPIAAQAALLTNRTADAGRCFAVRLHAVSTARDAIGTFVTITTDAGEIRQQLTAGDGYQATNERVLRFGLGRNSVVHKVVIEWPGGVSQIIVAVPANTLLVVVEGRPPAMRANLSRQDGAESRP